MSKSWWKPGRVFIPLIQAKQIAEWTRALLEMRVFQQTPRGRVKLFSPVRAAIPFVPPF